MKSAINQWAFPSDMSTTDAITHAKRLGFEAFEICVDEKTCFKLDSSEADVTAVRRHAEAAGIEISSIACGMGWAYPLSSNDESVRKRGKEIVAKSLQIGEWLGVDALLTVPGTVGPDTSYDQAIENSLLALRDLVPVAEKHKVAIAVENVWNKFLLSPVEMRDYIDQLESDYVGAYFDTGNIILYGYPEQWIRILGKRIRSIHAKDYRASVGTLGGFVMLMEGDVNWPQVMAALREVGYNGALVAEFGPYGHSLDVMLQHVLTSLNAIKAM